MVTSAVCGIRVNPLCVICVVCRDTSCLPLPIRISVGGVARQGILLVLAIERWMNSTMTTTACLSLWLGHMVQVSLFPIYTNVLNQISALDLSAAEGAKVRSRVKWAEEGKPLSGGLMTGSQL